MKDRFLNAMKFRHACKVFDESRKISENEFKNILEIGRLSPSSFGFEPWKFLIVQNMELREKLLPMTWGAQGTLPTASHFVIILARKEKSIKFDCDYIDYMMKEVQDLPVEVVEGKRKVFTKFQQSDFSLLESPRAIFDWSSKQTYLAMANMMTGAAYMGIDSCPIEGFDVAEVTKVLEDDFKIDTQEFGIATMIAFGYRKDAPARSKTRKSMEEISTWYK
jgi:nitroreductase